MDEGKENAQAWKPGLRITKWETVFDPDPTALGRAAEAFIRTVLISRQQSGEELDPRSAN